MDYFAREVKVCILGQSGVGKSSLALRFVKNKFHPELGNTIGAAFLSRNVSTGNGKKYKLQIWDTAGQERFKSLTPMYYRKAAIVIIVYDITNRNSMSNGVMDWVREIRLQESSDSVLVLVGNKLDKTKEDGRQVNKEEAEKYAVSVNALFFEASAKSGENVMNIFLEACARLDSTKLPVHNEFIEDCDTHPKIPQNRCCSS